MLPLLWFGFLALLASAMVAESGPRAEFLLLVLVLAILGYLLMRRFVFDLVDEVWDAGDLLIVKNDNQEERIPLAAIARVSHSPIFSPPRITLTLNEPSRFGDKVSFSPPAGFPGFRQRTLAADLTARLEATRASATSAER